MKKIIILLVLLLSSRPAFSFKIDRGFCTIQGTTTERKFQNEDRYLIIDPEQEDDDAMQLDNEPSCPTKCLNLFRPSSYTPIPEQKKTSTSPYLFAVFDGHGGPQVSDWIEQHFEELFINQLQGATSLQEALKITIARCEEEILDKRGWDTIGSTLALLAYNPDKNYLITATVGDSQVLIYNANIKQSGITPKHDPFVNEKERERVTKSRATFWKDNKTQIPKSQLSNYTTGYIKAHPNAPSSLGMSRVLGDRGSKCYSPSPGITHFVHVISAKPEFIAINDFPKNHELYIVIASDGLWDFMSPDDLLPFFNNDTAQRIAQKLCLHVVKLCKEDRKSHQKFYRDDITAIVVRLVI